MKMCVFNALKIKIFYIFKKIIAYFRMFKECLEAFVNKIISSNHKDPNNYLKNKFNRFLKLLNAKNYYYKKNVKNY